MVKNAIRAGEDAIKLENDAIDGKMTQSCWEMTQFPRIQTDCGLKCKTHPRYLRRKFASVERNRAGVTKNPAVFGHKPPEMIKDPAEIGSNPAETLKNSAD